MNMQHQQPHLARGVPQHPPPFHGGNIQVPPPSFGIPPPNMPQNIPCTSAAVVKILLRSSNGVKVSKRLVDVFKVLSQSLEV